MIKSFLIILFIICSLEADTIPFKLFYKNSGIKISSYDDKLIIKDIKINKGKCKTELIPVMRLEERKTYYNLPLLLPEFESMSIIIEPYCKVMRIDVTTNKGSWNFNY